jgi:hypothetical protein
VSEYVCPCGVAGSPHDRPGESEHHSAWLRGEDGPLRDPYSVHDAQAREHMRRVPGHELTVGSDDQWHCLTCEGEEER